MLYDSSYTNKLSRDLIFTIGRLTGKQQKDKLVLLIPKVSQQPDGTSCGLYAIANLTSVILKADPQVQRYNQSKLRSSLLSYCETAQLHAFPKNRGRAPVTQTPTAIEI